MQRGRYIWIHGLKMIDIHTFIWIRSYIYRYIYTYVCVSPMYGHSDMVIHATRMGKSEEDKERTVWGRDR